MRISIRLFRAYLRYMTYEEKIEEREETKKITNIEVEIINPISFNLPDYLGNRVDIIV